LTARSTMMILQRGLVPRASAAARAAQSECHLFVTIL
jgi:hypothetical protein